MKLLARLGATATCKSRSFYKPSALVMVLVAGLFSVSGCSDNGPDKKRPPQPTAVQTPVAPAPLVNPMQFVILDAQTGELLSAAVDVRVSGADAASFSNDNALISPNKPNQYSTSSGIIQFDVAGTPSATPLAASFSFELNGYYSEVVDVQLDQDGFSLNTVILSPRIFTAGLSATAIATTATISANVSPATGELGEELVLQTDTNSADAVLGESQFTLTLPDNTITTNAEANTVFTPLTLQATYFPIDASNAAAMRATPLTAIYNSDEILSLGLVHLYLIDSNVVKLESFDSDVSFSFEVPNTVINPITGSALALNDSMKFFSRDISSGLWNDPATGFDATVTAIGTTHATVEVTVPANTSFADQTWNLGWTVSQVPALCPMGVQFDVVDANGLPAEELLLLKTTAANGAWATLFDTGLNPWFAALTSQSSLNDLPDLQGEIVLYNLLGEALTEQITLADTSTIAAIDGKVALNSLCDLQGATVQISTDNTELELVDTEVTTALLCDVAIPVDINGDPIDPVPTPAFNNVIYNGAILGSMYADGATPSEFKALPADQFLQFRADTFDTGQNFSIFEQPQPQFSNSIPTVCPAL